MYQRSHFSTVSISRYMKLIANDWVFFPRSGHIIIVLASFPGSWGCGEKRAWYTLFAHARTAVEFHRLRLPYHILSCTCLVMNYSYKLASRPLLLRPSTKRFLTPLGVSSVPIYALGPLTEQCKVKECRFAMWCYNYMVWVQV